MTASELLISARKKPDWLVALVMLAGGSVPAAALGFLLDFSSLSCILAVVVFWPCAALAGGFVTRGERS